MKQQRMTVGKIKELVAMQATEDKGFLDGNMAGTPTLESLVKAEHAAARYHFCQHLLKEMGTAKAAPVAKKKMEKATEEKVKKVVRKAVKRRGRPKKEK